jgi:hypothetical protein
LPSPDGGARETLQSAKGAGGDGSAKTTGEKMPSGRDEVVEGGKFSLAGADFKRHGTAWSGVRNGAASRPGIGLFLDAASFVAVIGPAGRHALTLRLAGPRRPAGGEQRPTHPMSEPVKRAPVPRELLQVTPGCLQDSHFLQAMSNPTISGINSVLILSYDH